MKRFLALFCCVAYFFLIFASPADASALPGVGTLAIDEIARIILGAFGVAVAPSVDLGVAGQALLDTIAAAAGPGLDSQAVSQAVQSWADLAVQGTIQIASALPWIQSGMRDFVEFVPDTLTTVSTAPGAPASSASYPIVIGGSSVSVTCTEPVNLAYFGTAPSSGHSNYSYSSYVVLYSSARFTCPYTVSCYSNSVGSLYWVKLNPYSNAVLGPFYGTHSDMMSAWDSSQNSYFDSLISPSAASVAVGGIQAVLPEYGLSGVSVPDLDVASAAAVAGVTASVYAGGLADQLNAEEIPWSSYVGALTGGVAPTITLTDDDNVTATYVITDVGIGVQIEVESTTPPEDPTEEPTEPYEPPIVPLDPLMEVLNTIKDNLADYFSFIPEFFQNLFTWLESIYNKLCEILEVLENFAISVVTGEISLSEIKDYILEALSELFIPSPDYLSTKVDQLAESFPFIQPIVLGVQAISGSLASGAPPVIYIDLSAATGRFTWGPSMIFVDMSFYAPYKATGDLIIASFLWLLFAWKMFKKLPGIISGSGSDAEVIISHVNDH